MREVVDSSQHPRLGFTLAYTLTPAARERIRLCAAGHRIVEQAGLEPASFISGYALLLYLIELLSHRVSRYVLAPPLPPTNRPGLNIRVHTIVARPCHAREVVWGEPLRPAPRNTKGPEPFKIQSLFSDIVIRTATYGSRFLGANTETSIPSFASAPRSTTSSV